MGKQYKLLFSIVLGLFLGLFLLLCSFNRLATDDFYFIWDVRNHGIITGVTSQYMEWCGRYSATFSMDVFYKAFGLKDAFYNVIPAVSVLLLFAGTFCFLTNCVERKLVDLRDTEGGFDIFISKSWMALISAAFTALSFFLSVDIGESWFWFCAQSSYLWSIIAFIWCCVFLTGRKNSVSLLLAIICIIYVGAASEIYSVFYGLFFTLIIFRLYRSSTSFRTFFTAQKRLLIVYSFFSLSFLVFLVAPGNYLRDGLFPEHQFWYSFFITAKSAVKFLLFYLPFKIHYVLIFAFPFLVLGESLGEFEFKGFRWSYRTFLIRSTLVFLATLFLFFFIVAYVMVETGPPRVWFFVSFLFAIYCCLNFFYAGYKWVVPAYLQIRLRAFSLGLGVFFMMIHIFRQVPVASAYADAVDKRTEYIVRLNSIIQRDTLILLEPLPPPGMLYSTEISTDTTHFTNKELRLGYELKFHVAKK